LILLFFNINIKKSINNFNIYINIQYYLIITEKTGGIVVALSGTPKIFGNGLVIVTFESGLIGKNITILSVLNRVLSLFSKNPGYSKLIHIFININLNINIMNSILFLPLLPINTVCVPGTVKNLFKTIFNLSYLASSNAIFYYNNSYYYLN